jgi:hypothetical protein
MRNPTERSSFSLIAGGSLLLFVIVCTVPAQVSIGATSAGTVELDGSSIWRNATDLEQVGTSYPANRCAGSAGANASAALILSRFQQLGLEAWTEGFQFYGWDLALEPSMEVIYLNGSSEETFTLTSFQAEQFSAPTLSDGARGELVLLPLPSTISRGSFSGLSYNPSGWQGIDVHDRIVLVGREVRWNPEYEAGLAEKLREGPAALVFFYSQPWSLSYEVMFSASSGGMPLSYAGTYLHDHSVPAGHIDAVDTGWLLDKLDQGNISAKIRIDSTEGIWTQSNVVALLPGQSEDADQILLTAHYDTVMDGGFCDNAASVAIMIEVAAKLAEMRDGGALDPSCAIRFIALTGEELGLVGSSYYFAMHANEMGEVRAVVNIDCLGAGVMSRSTTDSSQGIDLDELVDRCVADAGISSIIDEGSSDHQSFLYPRDVAWQIQSLWGICPQIGSEATSVTSSICLSSLPLTPLDPYPPGHPGWIHTSRDSSSFCSSSGWVTEDNLEGQGNVVLALCLDLLGTAQDSDDSAPPLPVLTMVAVLVLVAAAIFLIVVLRRRAA